MLSPRHSLRIFLVLIVAAPLLPQTAPGEHLVSTSDLHLAARSVSQARQANLVKMEKFLSTRPAKDALRTLKIDPVQVTQKLSVLTDEELSRLAARSENIQNVAAGDVTKKTVLKYVIVGAAAAVIIALVVTHKAT